jgi:hypothetical protein
LCYNLTMKIIFILLMILFPYVAGADMQGNQYKIGADVIGIGGDTGTSDSYRITDTIGEPVIGTGTSETYKTKAGFRYMAGTSLALTIDSNTVNLGMITPGSPVTGQSVLNVTTDAWAGYDLLANENHKMTHTDTITTIDDYSCDITNPCLWSGTGLGFTILSGTSIESKWGSNPNYKYAYFPASATVFHTKTGYKSGADTTTVVYKADTPSTQRSGSYSNIVTFTAMEKL